MRGDALRFKVLAHIEVPHVANVHRTLIANESLRRLLFPIFTLESHCSLLCSQCQLKVVTEVETVAQVLLDLLFNWINCFICFRGQVSVYWDQFNLVELEDDRWILIRSNW